MSTGVEKRFERNCGTVKIGSRLPFTNDMYSMSYLHTEEWGGELLAFTYCCHMGSTAVLTAVE